MMFSLCCPLYSLELVPGKHCPVEEMARSIAGSITTTMSICLDDTELSWGLGKDVRSEQLKTDIRRVTGWPWYPGQGLHGGGNKMEEENGNMTKSSSVLRKRQAPGKAEILTKKSKLLREYNQVTPKKSPTKTPRKGRHQG